MTHEVRHLELKPGTVLRIATTLGNTIELRIVEVEIQGTYWSPRLTVDFGTNHPGFARPHEVVLYATNDFTVPPPKDTCFAFRNAPAQTLKPGTLLLFAGESVERTWNMIPATIAAVTVAE